VPIYEYECESCQFRFEKKQGFYDEPLSRCPRCQGKARRVFYPAPIIFKAGGFYVTDNRKGRDIDSERDREKPAEKVPERPVKKEKPEEK
jgi:putative FmdB family regulatory protein